MQPTRNMAMIALAFVLTGCRTASPPRHQPVIAKHDPTVSPSMPTSPVAESALDAAFDEDELGSQFSDGFLLDGKVVAFGDGDTFKIQTSSHGTVSIRFHGVDTPESAGSRWPEQPFSREAKEFVQDMVGDRPVMVRMKGEATYQREVGEPFVDGRSISRELVRAGLGWWYDNYARYDSDLERLQVAAKGGRLGLWSASNPVKPADWRRGVGH